MQLEEYESVPPAPVPMTAGSAYGEKPAVTGEMRLPSHVLCREGTSPRAVEGSGSLRGWHGHCPPTL